jgi:hypothetical protein
MDWLGAGDFERQNGDYEDVTSYAMNEEHIQVFGLELAAFAKSGPASKTHAAEIVQCVDKLIEANATSVDEAVAAYRLHCAAFLERVVEAKGIPVASVVSAGGDAVREQPKSVDKAVSARFDELLPVLRALRDEHVDSHAEQASAFFEKQKSAFDAQLAAFLSEIPIGGTKAAVVRGHVNPLKRALSDLLEWGGEMSRLQAMSFVSEVSDFLTPAGGDALAMTWQYSRPSCLVPSHEALHSRVYLVRDSWALKQGLLRADVGFVEDTRKFRREIGCMCLASWHFSLPRLPEDLLTPAGVAKIEEARAKREEFMAASQESAPTPAATTPPHVPDHAPVAAPAAGFFSKLFRNR